MLKDMFNNKLVLIGLAVCLTYLVVMLTNTVNFKKLVVDNIINAPETELLEQDNEILPETISKIDINRRVVTVFDCAALNDFEVLSVALTTFREHSEKLFVSSRIKRSNQKNRISLDRINGNCTIKMGPVYNSPAKSF